MSRVKIDNIVRQRTFEWEIVLDFSGNNLYNKKENQGKHLRTHIAVYEGDVEGITLYKVVSFTDSKDMEDYNYWITSDIYTSKEEALKQIKDEEKWCKNYSKEHDNKCRSFNIDDDERDAKSLIENLQKFVKAKQITIWELE